MWDNMLTMKLFYLLFTICSLGLGLAQNQKLIQTPNNSTYHRIQEEDLHRLWTEILQTHVSNDGIVNYKLLKKDPKKLQNYLSKLDVFYSSKTFQLLSKDGQLAFWINAYNAFTVDLIIRHYPVKSIKEIKNPWKQRLWKLGGTFYNLKEIEHDILRKRNEPRIHFAIVCASYSCPKLLNEAYNAKNIELQLTNASKDFLTDQRRNNISKYSLKISKIFDWFAVDFKQKGSLINFLNAYSSIVISPTANISYQDYNWNLNE